MNMNMAPINTRWLMAFSSILGCAVLKYHFLPAALTLSTIQIIKDTQSHLRGLNETLLLTLQSLLLFVAIVPPSHILH